MGRREDVGELGGGCQGRDHLELDKGEGSGEIKGPIWELWSYYWLTLHSGPQFPHLLNESYSRMLF